MLLHDFTDSHPFLPPKRHPEFVGRMLNLIHAGKDRPDRLRASYSDFWGANFFFRADGPVWVIDYSRIPWGDPATDSGWWLAQYLWFYHETKNSYFRDLGERFLALYERETVLQCHQQDC